MSTDQPSILDSVVSTQQSSNSGYLGNGPDDQSGFGKGGAKTIAIAVAVVLVIILLYYMMSPQRGGVSSKLAKKGWILYTRDGCGYCTKQLKELGGHYPKIVRCAQGGTLVKSDVNDPPSTCAQITGFPTWINTKTGDKKVGFQKQHDLEAMC
jgi:hypothetical protein